MKIRFGVISYLNRAALHLPAILATLKQVCSCATVVITRDRRSRFVVRNDPVSICEDIF